jgi:hypothetical protein
MPAISRDLNAIVKFFGGLVRHTYTSNQYPSFEKLQSDYEQTGSIRVNVDHSDNTIFGSPSINWLFRAWHDQCHLITGGGFDRAGETLALREQQRQRQINAHPGITPRDRSLFCSILESEVLGQLDYFETHGDFPVNQYDYFVSQNPHLVTAINARVKRYTISNTGEYSVRLERDFSDKEFTFVSALFESINDAPSDGNAAYVPFLYIAPVTAVEPINAFS